MTVKFSSNKKERDLIAIIVDRAFGEQLAKDKVSLTMDLDATHSNGTKLDFAKLAAFDTFNFAHDIVGIQNHIDRKTGKTLHCFLPRCAR